MRLGTWEAGMAQRNRARCAARELRQWDVERGTGARSGGYLRNHRNLHCNQPYLRCYLSYLRYLHCSIRSLRLLISPSPDAGSLPLLLMIMKLVCVYASRHHLLRPLRHLNHLRGSVRIPAISAVNPAISDISARISAISAVRPHRK